MNDGKATEQVYAPGRPWREYLDEQMRDLQFRAEYEALDADVRVSIEPRPAAPV